MSTLRVSNIEVKADASSPSVNEKLKVTNSNGDVLIHVNGETSGVTTVGINTTGSSFDIDSNQNVTFAGIVTSTEFVGNVTGNVTGNATGLSGSPTLSGITSVSTTNLTVNGNAYPSDGSLSNRNLVINGAMMVSQRSTSATSITSSGYYTIDRQQLAFVPDGGVLTESQSTDAPEDFAYSRKLEVTTAGGASGWLLMAYQFEGKDLYSIRKGTAAAKPLTLSFWVKANHTADYVVELIDTDNDRIISYLYTINAANTWQKVEWNIPADTTGAFTLDNEQSLQISWFLDPSTIFTGGTPSRTSWSARGSNQNRAVGCDHFLDTLGKEFYITGIQLETGSVATPFEHRSYGDELAKCQRYFQGWNATSSTERLKTGIKVYDDEGNGSANQTTILGTGAAMDADDARIHFSLPVSMRAAPTTSVGDLRLITGSTLHNTSTTVQYNNSTTHNFSGMLDNDGGMTTGQCVHMIIKGNGYFYLDAEL